MNNKINKVSCAIVGARGYSGLELTRILLRHPRAHLKYCFATEAYKVKDSEVIGLPESELFNHLADIVFLATPAEVSLRLAPKIIVQGKKVIDLSGAFRLKKNDYLKWYGFEHHEKEILNCAQYGLSPWAGPSSPHNLVANPGCFATAIAMALIPLVKEDVIQPNHVVIDAKSGTTGAGKKAVENLLFTEVEGECLPYKIGRHQHHPEIVETVESLTGQKIEVQMTTSLLSTRRGIIAGIYAQLKPNKTMRHVEEAFIESYKDYPLVRFGSVHEVPHLLSLKKVVGTGRVHLSYEVVNSQLYLFSCIDNLLKGAASQAVENMNRILDLPLDTGLNGLEAIT